MTDTPGRTGPVINLADLAYEEHQHGDRYEARYAQVAALLGARKLGYNVTEVAPGKAGWPRHAHRVIEEMFFILEGEGELAIGEGTWPVGPGDVVACPPGGPETAHQLRNTSDDQPLRFLAVSTMEFPDVVQYPDSGKFLLRTSHPDTPAGEDGPRFIGRLDDGRDYWEGE